MSIQQAVRPAVLADAVRVVSGAEARVSLLQYERLEAQSWAPWLRFSRAALAKHLRAFSGEQFFASDDGRLVGALSTNRICWDGDPATLGTWDAVAGARQDYADTHDQDGNTLVLMSMSIAPQSRANGIARRLVEAARASARARGLEHVIGDFRPSGYGSFKTHDPSGFLSYVAMRDQDGLPIDPWLRAVTRMGMRRLRVDERAMVIPVDLKEFERLRALSAPLDWVRVERARDAFLHAPALPIPVTDCECWEVGQTGTWYVERSPGRATYVESGVWGTFMSDGVEE